MSDQSSGGKSIALFAGILILLFYAHVPRTYADDQTEAEQTIGAKKSAIDQINQQIDAYQKKIDEAQSQQTSLANELDVLQNRVEKTQLQINETNAEIDLTKSEIAKTDQDILNLQKKLDHEKELITQVVQRIQGQDNTLPIELFYGSDRFSSLLDTVQKLEQINGDLSDAVTEARATKANLEQTKAVQQTKRDELQTFEQTLKDDQTRLNEETDAKQILLDTTQQSEKRFQRLVSDLKQEQASIQSQIQDLQSNLEQKIQPSDRIGGGLLLWPINPSLRGVSATFHDPTYPFRNLFEHPGIDLPAPMGTPVHAAASGYVAWTRRGVQYGNYVMVIHSDGIATLYAHLSRIDVVADQFIPRGGQIGLVGMTGLTTGPHLHFEVRKEGIPTDPTPYLHSF